MERTSVKCSISGAGNLTGECVKGAEEGETGEGKLKEGEEEGNKERKRSQSKKH